MRLTHPDYLSDDRWGRMQQAQGVVTADFRAKTGTIVMPRGFDVVGEVLTAGGEPIEGAIVTWHTQQEWGTSQKTVYTDAAGGFRLPVQPPVNRTLSVFAKDFAPIQTTIAVPDVADPLRFHLEEGTLDSVFC
ncbi:MAG: carboxypeptidase-like regulatory domain-containing protein [Planctomycetaceae bacterium]